MYFWFSFALILGCYQTSQSTANLARTGGGRISSLHMLAKASASANSSTVFQYMLVVQETSQSGLWVCWEVIDDAVEL